MQHLAQRALCWFCVASDAACTEAVLPLLLGLWGGVPETAGHFFHLRSRVCEETPSIWDVLFMLLWLLQLGGMFFFGMTNGYLAGCCPFDVHVTMHKEVAQGLYLPSKSKCLYLQLFSFSLWFRALCQWESTARFCRDTICLWASLTLGFCQLLLFMTSLAIWGFSNYFVPQFEVHLWCATLE